MRHRSAGPTVFGALAIVVGASFAPQSLNAQGRSPLVGRWTVEYEVGRMMEDGEARGIRGTGTFNITSSGDSLLVTIQGPARPDGTVPEPSTVGARSINGEATFIQKQKVRVNLNGDVTMQNVELTWTLKADGDALTGTLARHMQDMPEMLAPSPVSGKRIKS